MNKTLLSAAMVAVIAATAFAPSAQAADGTITINGLVIANACTVNVNGGATVVLPTVMTSTLATAGAVAGNTPFNIALTGCDPSVTSATMAFSGSNINATSGNLTNTVTTGSDAQIQLLANATVLDLRTGTATTAVASSAGTFAMQAQYVAVNAGTSAGLVKSSVEFTLTYL